MNIYRKLDQFIKSARFILEYRDFQKQADLNFHVAPGLNYRVNPGAGSQNARQFYNRVKPGFNPKPTKHKSHSRYSSPHVRPTPTPQRPQDPSGYSFCRGVRNGCDRRCCRHRPCPGGFRHTLRD